MRNTVRFTFYAFTYLAFFLVMMALAFTLSLTLVNITGTATQESVLEAYVFYLCACVCGAFLAIRWWPLLKPQGPYPRAKWWDVLIALTGAVFSGSTPMVLHDRTQSDPVWALGIVSLIFFSVASAALIVPVLQRLFR